VNGRGRRNKGATGEREVANLLSDQLGTVVKRKLGQARDGGDDIQVGRFHIEVKRQERLAIEQWCQQVELACTSVTPIDQEGQLGRPVPVVVFRRNGQPWRAVVPFDFLIHAMREDLSGQRYVPKGEEGGDVDNG
jgi:hypothetical protein